MLTALADWSPTLPGNEPGERKKTKIIKPTVRVSQAIHVRWTGVLAR